MITTTLAQHYFELYKAIALNEYLRGNYCRSLEATSISARIAYHYALKFYDEDLENLIHNIAVNKLCAEERHNVQNGNYIFYDYYALPNRGLTQQYVRALSKIAEKVLYIVPKREDNIDQRIKDEFSALKNVEMLFIGNDGNDIFSHANIILRHVREFAPEKSFLHLAPWDCLGNLIWTNYTDTSRYFVNITDHAFWLGVKCTDFCLEWRDYGASISTDYRMISHEQIVLIPYYPIMDSENFHGFCGDETNNVKIFSGGHLFKIYDEENTFFKIVSEVLKDNEDAVFYYAGGGNTQQFIRFMTDAGVMDRCYLLGNRRDIIDVVSKMDVFFHTYPISGGLMAQIAAGCGKPVVAYTESWNTDCIIDCYFDTKKPMQQITFFDKKEAVCKLNSLVNDKILREEEGAKLKQALFTAETFDRDVSSAVLNGKDLSSFSHLDISLSQIQKMYEYLDNLSDHQLYRINKNNVLRRYKPWLYIGNLFTILCVFDKKKMAKKFFGKSGVKK